jgi:hypothetical protein
VGFPHSRLHTRIVVAVAVLDRLVEAGESIVKALGPHQCATRSGFDMASKTSLRGASKTRVMTISRSEGIVSVVAFPPLVILISSFICIHPIALWRRRRFSY